MKSFAFALISAYACAIKLESAPMPPPQSGTMPPPPPGTSMPDGAMPPPPPGTSMPDGTMPPCPPGAPCGPPPPGTSMPDGTMPPPPPGTSMPDGTMPPLPPGMEDWHMPAESLYHCIDSHGEEDGTVSLLELVGALYHGVEAGVIPMEAIDSFGQNVDVTGLMMGHMDD